MPICVLNTRPQHQAIALTRAIEKRGGKVFHLPVFEIQLLLFDVGNTTQFDYMIFLSANAAAFYFQQSSWVSGTIIAIGPATQLALEKQGVKNILLPKQFNSTGIVDLLSLQSVLHKKIAIISGENAKPLLGQIMQSRGAEIQEIICYRRRPILYNMVEIFEKLSQQQIDCMVSTSFESYFALLALFQNPIHHAWLLQKTICVINVEMKKQALADGFVTVIQAEHATNEAIVKEIQEFICYPLKNQKDL